jgi:hypothetical protein
LVRRSRVGTTALAYASLLLGCGDSQPAIERGSVELEWTGAPRVAESATLADEHVASGRVRNVSGDSIELAVGEVSVISTRGERLASSAAFLAGFVKPVEGLNRPDTLAQEDLDRLGRTATIAPGETRPLTVAWREAGGAGSADRVELGAEALPLP